MQVGKDPAATRFLSALDVDPVIGGMIDCTSYYEQEQEEYARKVIDLLITAFKQHKVRLLLTSCNQPLFHFKNKSKCNL